MNSLACRTMVLLSLLTLAACASTVRSPVPEDQYQTVTVLGKDYYREWGDEAIALDDLMEGHRDSHGDWPTEYLLTQQHNYLALSGGGANGAYGAGVLVGWTATGERPEFTVVTGISTGALIAPFAFLGPEYDDVLQELFTTSTTADIARKRYLNAVFGAEAAMDTAPLRRLLETYVDERFVAQLQTEYLRGRQLLVGTSNLDAGRPVLWNLTMIAASGHANAGDLIRKGDTPIS